MSSKNVDFIAVLIITLSLLAFSRVSELIPHLNINPIGFQSAVINGPSCPLADEIRAGVESLVIR